MERLQCFEKEVQQAKEAHVPYNALRVCRPLKEVVERYNNAIVQEFIIYDDSKLIY